MEHPSAPPLRESASLLEESRLADTCLAADDGVPRLSGDSRFEGSLKLRDDTVAADEHRAVHPASHGTDHTCDSGLVVRAFAANPGQAAAWPNRNRRLSRREKRGFADSGDDERPGAATDR